MQGSSTCTQSRANVFRILLYKQNAIGAERIRQLTTLPHAAFSDLERTQLQKTANCFLKSSEHAQLSRSSCVI